MNHPGKLSPALLVSVVVNLALVGGVGYLLLMPKKAGTGTYASGDTPSPKPTGAVEALGRIQPAGGVISVFGPPGDRVIQYTVKSGETVTAGKELATLAGATERKLNLDALDEQIKEATALVNAIRASAKAKLIDLQAEADQATAGFDQDTKVLDAKVKAANKQADRARADRNRMEKVKAGGVPVSDQEFETIDVTLAVALAEAEAASAQKEKLKVQKQQSGVSITAKKVAVEAEADRAVAQVPLESLIAARKAAQRKADEARLLAPTAGTVVRLMAKPGDTLGNLPALQLADTGPLVVIAEVYETDVGRLREWSMKGPVKVDIDARVLANDKKLGGWVRDPRKVSSVIARNALAPLGPREDADRRVVEVEVDLDPDSAASVRDFIGLQVRATFLPPK